MSELQRQNLDIWDDPSGDVYREQVKKAAEAVMESFDSLEVPRPQFVEEICFEYYINNGEFYTRSGLRLQDLIQMPDEGQDLQSLAFTALSDIESALGNGVAQQAFMISREPQCTTPVLYIYTREDLFGTVQVKSLIFYRGEFELKSFLSYISESVPTVLDSMTATYAGDPCFLKRKDAISKHVIDSAIRKTRAASVAD